MEGDGRRPDDDGVRSIRDELVTCAPRSATGHVGGQAFPIVLVDADGRPAEVQTANAYHRMQSAAAEDGVSLRVVSGFRSYAEQDYLYQCFVNCDCNQCNLAAFPGYSNHQSGSALDLNTHEPGVYGWLLSNAAGFGFVATVPGEDWHWEFYGPSVGAGPCRHDGEPAVPAGPSLEFVSPRDRGRYANGLWMKARIDAEVALVRYYADGWFLGASEDHRDDHSVRYVFNTLGRRQLRAEAVAPTGEVIATQEITVDVAAGATSQVQVAFTAPRHDGWYRNGITFRVQAPSEVAAVRYFAGPYPLGTSRDRAEGFAVRQVFQRLGHRAILAVAEDASGREVARRAIAIRVLPGEEGPVALQIVAPGPGTSHQGAVRFVTVGSDSIRQVRYSADGWVFAESSQAGDFPVTHRFNVGGRRTILAEGFDARGAPVAEHRITVNVE